ncbi:hypothetical protein BH24ACT3_BH24ACT3_05740 [soil metagenome]
MIFNSIEYAVFLPVVVVAYLVMRDHYEGVNRGVDAYLAGG